MLIYTLPFLVLTCLYLASLLVLGKGLRKTRPGSNKIQFNVSIVVAARNEERNIGACLNALLKQTYPNEKLQIIVIDDRSEDDTPEIVKKFAASHAQIRLLQIKDKKSNFAPKKRAIDLGIQHANGEIIFTTDADCRPASDWVTEMIKYFEPNVGLVAGYNPYQILRNSLFNRILALDYFSMAAVAAAFARSSYPVSCSGGNLAYRKELYLQLGGFQNFGKWVSGDDDFFLEQIRDCTNWKIRYSTFAATQVPTAPPATLREFINQRIRYASKGRDYRPAVTFGLIGIYFLNLLITAGPVFSIISPSVFPVWLVGFMIKILSEFMFLRKAAKIFDEQFDWLTFTATAVVHPVYITIIGLLGQFKKFYWKGEKYAKVMQTPSLSMRPKTNLGDRGGP